MAEALPVAEGPAERLLLSTSSDGHTFLYATGGLRVSITHAATGEAVEMVEPMGQSTSSGLRWVREKYGKFEVPEAGDYRVVAMIADGAVRAEPSIVIR